MLNLVEISYQDYVTFAIFSAWKRGKKYLGWIMLSKSIQFFFFFFFLYNITLKDVPEDETNT